MQTYLAHMFSAHVSVSHPSSTHARPLNILYVTSIAVAEHSKAWVYSRSLAGFVGSNPTWGMDVCLLRV